MYFDNINYFNNNLKDTGYYICKLCFLSVMTKFLCFFLETQYNNYSVKDDIYRLPIENNEKTA